MEHLFWSCKQNNYWTITGLGNIKLLKENFSSYKGILHLGKEEGNQSICSHMDVSPRLPCFSPPPTSPNCCLWKSNGKNILRWGLTKNNIKKLNQGLLFSVVILKKREGIRKRQDWKSYLLQIAILITWVNIVSRHFFLWMHHTFLHGGIILLSLTLLWNFLFCNHSVVVYLSQPLPYMVICPCCLLLLTVSPVTPQPSEPQSLPPTSTALGKGSPALLLIPVNDPLPFSEEGNGLAPFERVTLLFLQHLFPQLRWHVLPLGFFQLFWLLLCHLCDHLSFCPSLK